MATPVPGPIVRVVELEDHPVLTSAMFSGPNTEPSLLLSRDTWEYLGEPEQLVITLAAVEKKKGRI